ncbi:Aste57867_15158 [Aphanomyces stellatus]|uniref:Aste57867_15158 protein n=1 Tax=Aphanomyces stellatus TaxID=120398 RepID=A0A485L3G7_9STRA|nr:hypothetical protein As57867_015102 [Aphanomyces stellatus]VFT91967.1 Aste57867_15158 [Aphanomyces stellatus]
MIPVLIDPSPSLKNPATWTGEVGFVLGGHLYLDLSNAFDDEQLMATRMGELVSKINGIGGPPIAQRFGGGIEQQASGIPSVVKDTPRLPPAKLASLSTVPLTTLTKEQVATMLTGLACSKYSATFLENEITGAVLGGAAGVDDIKEMGVTLSAKARMLFDAITDFKASGVPTALLLPSTSTVTEPPPEAKSSHDPLSFAKHIAELLPAGWVRLYNYKLEAHAKNCTPTKHALEWPEPPCSFSLSSGLFLNGQFQDEVKDKWQLLLLETLGGRWDKADFLVTFQIKIMQGGATPLCTGYRPWFAIDITTDMCFIIAFNEDEDVHVVKQNGQPIVLPVDVWLEIGIFMCLQRRTVEVVVGTAKMDPIELDQSFEFKLFNNKVSCGNALHLVRRDTFAKMFHGYLRKIELHSTAPASRDRPLIRPRNDTVHAKHVKMLGELTTGTTCLLHYPAMHHDVVDTVNHRMLPLPVSSYTHETDGVYFDGDFCGEWQHNPFAGVAGSFGLEFKNRHFVYAVEMVPLGDGWVLCLVVHMRWFGVFVRDDMTIEITAENESVGRLCCVNTEPVRLTKGAWTQFAIKMDGTSIDVVIDGATMDRIELGDDFAFNDVEKEGGDIRLVNYGTGTCFHGFLKSLALWST